MDERFLGTWLMLSWENRDEAGEIGHPVGREPLGLLHYASDGYMFVHIMRADRAALSTDALFGGGAAERAEAFSSHVAYSGRWEVSGGTMIHRLEVSSVPNWTGSEQHRTFDFPDPDRLQLSAPMEFGDREWMARVMWRRV